MPTSSCCFPVVNAGKGEEKGEQCYFIFVSVQLFTFLTFYTEKVVLGITSFLRMHVDATRIGDC